MTGADWLPLLLVVGLAAGLALGLPVAFTLAGVALLFAGIGSVSGHFDPAYLNAFPNRIFGTLGNETLLAVPLFVFMGVMLERSQLAERLLTAMAALFGSVRGGLAISVTLVGAVLAASTGIVGATVVTMGLIALPTMLRAGYDPKLACGTICAAGTLGQIIPPSVILVLLGDVLGNAYQKAQLDQGVFAPKTVAVGDLFAGAVFPGLLLVGAYLLYLILSAWRRPASAPPLPAAMRPNAGVVELAKALLPPLLLVLAVLGSILGGIATPTEAAAIGAVGATLLAALSGGLTPKTLRQTAEQTALVTSMVYAILIAAALFSLVFRGFGGDDAVHHWLSSLPGGVIGALILVNLAVFLLGFLLDFIEIVFIVVPLVAPPLLMMGIDPIWLGVMLAINLQTSFLTPPFGFALFYLRGAAPPEIDTTDIYRGVVPFIGIQLLVLLVLAVLPGLATWLPRQL
jgi:tripartite ATP-independent transporter DctM subunit